MNRIKETLMYILALIVLLAPAIILGWIGLSLIGWVGLVIGVIAGLAIFAYSVNKFSAEQEELEEGEETAAENLDTSGHETAPQHQEAR